MIADSGIIIRTPVQDISTFSRVSQGVKIMKLKNDAKITGVAVTEKEEEEETSEETQEAEKSSSEENNE